VALVTVVSGDPDAHPHLFAGARRTERPPDWELRWHVVDPSGDAGVAERLERRCSELERNHGVPFVLHRVRADADAAWLAGCRAALADHPAWVGTVGAAVALHPRWLVMARKALNRLRLTGAEPVALGIYDSPRHERLGPWVDGVVEKRSVGTTCTLVRAERVRELAGADVAARVDAAGFEATLGALLTGSGDRVAALSPCFAQNADLDRLDRGAVPEFSDAFAGASYGRRRFGRIHAGRERPSPETAAPLLERYDRERARRRAALETLARGAERESVRLVMVGNEGFLDIFENWVRSCDRHGIEVRSWSLFFAADPAAQRGAEALGFRSYFDPDSYGELPSPAAEAFADASFRRLMFLKSAAVLDALELGQDVLFQDVDLVWFRDPLPWLLDPSRRPLDAQFMDDGANPAYFPFHANTGFFLLRNRPAVLRLWRRVVASTQRILDCGSQQRVVNEELPLSSLRLGILPPEDFANGHLWHSDGRNRLPPNPFVTHCSWTKNREHKIEKYRQQGLWYL
jgi:hypothetical protein